MSGIMMIGSYQLENIQRNQVPFILLDLRVSGTDVAHPLLQNAISVTPEATGPLLRQRSIPAPYPIILVCENGQASATVAADLEKADFLNIFVLEGGVASLSN